MKQIVVSTLQYDGNKVITLKSVTLNENAAINTAINNQISAVTRKLLSRGIYEFDVFRNYDVIVIDAKHESYAIEVKEIETIHRDIGDFLIPPATKKEYARTEKAFE